jgi:hypothetical protein
MQFLDIHPAPAMCKSTRIPTLPKVCRALSGAALLVPILLAPQGAAAQSYPVPSAAVAGPDGTTAIRSIRALPLAARISIDGRLDEAGWLAADPAASWVQRHPSSGRAASQQSEARVLYDGHAIYIGLRLFDSAPDSIFAPLARRDSEALSDWVHVIIDSDHDRRTAFRFSVNPSGVTADAYLTGDHGQNQDVGWDAIWSSAVARDSLGWTAELRIPFSQLRFSGSAANGARSWGIQFARDIARNGERSYWAPILPDAGGYVSRFGVVEELQVRPVRRFELAPYSVARLSRLPGESVDPFHRPNAWLTRFGADVKLGLAPELSLTATVLPDFGQIEADPSEVNLTTAETFFSERRPFFVEGSDLFQMDFGVAPWARAAEQVFYSRRIGRAPRGSVPEHAVYAQRPDAASLLGAAKLSVRTARGWSGGVLSAVTDEEHARYVDADGVRGAVPIEPLTHYAVARLTRDRNEGGSAVGAIVTSTARRLHGDLDELLPAHALVGGIDGRHRFGNDRFEVSVAVLGSHVTGSASAVDRVARGPVHYLQRPDAHHLHYDSARTALSGASATARVLKYGGGSWRGGLAGRLAGAGFDANDLGFHLASDFGHAHLWLGYEGFRGNRYLRRWSTWLNTSSTWNLGGDHLAAGVWPFVGAELANHWQIDGFAGREWPALSTTALRGGPAIHTPGRGVASFSVRSDQRKPVGLSSTLTSVTEDETGGWFRRIEPGISLRHSSSPLGLSLHAGYARSESPAQYVGVVASEGREHYLVGALSQTTISLTARLNYSLSPHLSLQLYGQPFVSTGSFRDFREVAEPRARAFDTRFSTFAAHEIVLSPDASTYQVTRGSGAAFSFGRPDFNVRELRSNAVLRWEYRPGSALFLIWGHGRNGFDAYGEADVLREFGRLREIEPANVFVAKLSYWLGR